MESVGVALSYRQALMTKLAEKARRRTNDAASSTLLMPNGQFGHQEQAERDVASSANAKEKSPPLARKEPKQPPPVKKEQVEKEPYAMRQDIPLRSRPRRRTRSPQRTKRRAQPQQQKNRRETRR